MMIKAGPVASTPIPASAAASTHDGNDEPFSAVLNDKLTEKGKSQPATYPANRLSREHHASEDHKQGEETASDLLGLALPQPGRDILNLQSVALASAAVTGALPLDATPATQPAALPLTADTEVGMQSALPDTSEMADSVTQISRAPGPAAPQADLTADATLAAVQETLAGEAERPRVEAKSGSLQRADLRAGADLPSLFTAQKNPLAAATSVAELKYNPLATPAQPAAMLETQQDEATPLTSKLQLLTADVPALKHDAQSSEIPLPGVAASLDAAAKSPLPATGATPAAVLNQPLGTPAWQHALGQQLSYFTRNGVHNAELRLHPEELGALQINLQLNNDKAQLHFATNNHQVRAAIEAAIPHLRTSLEESGIALGQSSVGEESSSWHASEQKKGSGRLNRLLENEDNAIDDREINNITHRMQIHNGINTFV